MVLLTLLEKIYGPDEGDAWRFFQETLASIASGLEIDFEIAGKSDRGWIQVEISGADTVVTANYLSQKFGSAPVSIENVHAPATTRGKVVDSGKIGYGIYVDVGVTSPEPIDALIPLHKMRGQLVEGRKLSIHQMIERFCLHDNLPLEIRLIRVDSNKGEIEAEFSEKQLTAFKRWLSLGFDRVIVLGATHDRVRHAIQRSGVSRYIVKLDQLGLLEHSLTCTLGTDAPGIIVKLGPHLPKTPLYAFFQE